MSGRASSRSLWSALGIALGGVLALWLFLVWQDSRFFWRNDYQLWYSPVFEETVRAWREGDWPILTQSSWTTANLGGEYQAGLFSLWHQGILLALWSLPLTLPGKAAALALVHLVLLAAGIVLLSLQRGASAPVAATTALTVTWSGWLVTWGANQWFVALGGFVWVAWGWWALERAQQESGGRSRWLWPGVIVYLQISEGSPFSVAMLAFVTAWLTLRALLQARDGGAFLPLLAAWALGIGLSAPAWWMLLELHAYSVRADWGHTWQWNWLVPWRAWLGLILPGVEFLWRDFWGQMSPRPAAVLLGGWVPLAALLAAFWAGLRRLRRSGMRESRGARSLLCSRRLRPRPSLGWSLGFALVVGLLCSLPLLGSFRWSFRWLPLFHLALALAAVEALRRVPGREVARAGLLLVLVAALGAWLAGALGSRSLLGVQLGLGAAWWLSSYLPKPWARWCPAYVVLLSAGASFRLLDLQQSSFAYSYPLTEELLEPSPLQRDRLYLGISSSADQLSGFRAPAGWGAILRPGNLPLAAGLHFLNGYSSFTAFGVPEWFETFGDMKPEKARVLLSPAADGLLGLLGVDGLIVGPEYRSLADQLGPEWTEAFVAPEATVFHREPARAARARVLPVDATHAVGALPTIRLLRESRLRVSVDIGGASSTGPAVVVFARPFLPGYEAHIGAQRLPVQCYSNLLPMVLIGPGTRGELELTFAPRSLRLGVPIALGSLLVLLAGCVFLRPRRGS